MDVGGSPAASFHHVLTSKIRPCLLPSPLGAPAPPQGRLFEQGRSEIIHGESCFDDRTRAVLLRAKFRQPLDAPLDSVKHRRWNLNADHVLTAYISGSLGRSPLGKWTPVISRLLAKMRTRPSTSAAPFKHSSSLKTRDMYSYLYDASTEQHQHTMLSHSQRRWMKSTKTTVQTILGCLSYCDVSAPSAFNLVRGVKTHFRPARCLLLLRGLYMHAFGVLWKIKSLIL